MIDDLVPYVVYGTCALTSVLAALLLLRGWRRTDQRLLLMVGLCFAGLAVNNLLLVIDLLVIPGIDLSLIRAVAGFAAVSGLLFALIWEAR